MLLNKSKEGISSLQGAHQVAQKFNKIKFPLNSFKFNCLFFQSRNVKPSYFLRSLLITRFFISLTSSAKELDNKKINIIKNLMLKGIVNYHGKK